MSARGGGGRWIAGSAAVRRGPVLSGVATLSLVLLGCASGAGTSAGQEANTLTDAERGAGWMLLFDGRTLAGWRGYNRSDMPEGWGVVDGALTRVGPARDIITLRQFEDFELSIEWRVDAGQNSGIFYRAAEGEAWIYHSAPEFQVLDDARHPDGRSELTSSGSNYGLHGAARGVVRPAGEWNAARILIRGDHVEHWLNGTKVVEYEFGSPEWEALVGGSKFDAWSAYGQAERGHIGLQEHGGRVQFRNIKIRELG